MPLIIPGKPQIDFFLRTTNKLVPEFLIRELFGKNLPKELGHGL